MALTHSRSERLSDTGPQPLVNPDELRRHQRALRILIVVLIPLAIWTDRRADHLLAGRHLSPRER